MDKMQLSPNNQFNGMSREDFKQMLISMGFEVSDCEGTGHISFDEDNIDEVINSVLPVELNLCENDLTFDAAYQVDVFTDDSVNDFKDHYSRAGVLAA